MYLVNKIKGLLLNQYNIIIKLKDELDKLTDILHNVKIDRQAIKVLESLEADIEKKENLSEKIEAMTNILFNRLIKFIENENPSDSRQSVKDIVYEIEKTAYFLVENLGRDGNLHKFLKTARTIEYWTMDKNEANGLLDSVLKNIKLLRSYLDQLDGVSNEINNMPYSRSDRLRIDVHYGEHLIAPHDYPYHGDCKTLLNRFENDFKDVVIPKISSIFTFNEPVILDAGCSTGLTTYAISRRYRFAKVIGLELNGNSIKKAKRNFRNLDFRQGNFYYLDSLFSQGYFDIVFMGNNLSIVMNRFKKSQINEILERARHVIKERGYLAIYDSEDQKVAIAQNIKGHFKYSTGKNVQKFPVFFRELMGA